MAEKGFLQTTILSGLIIAIVSYAYAVCGGSYFGSFLFSFGLMSIIYYKLHLFTGDAGFVKDEYDNEDLAVTLFGNIIGVVFGAILLSFCKNNNTEVFIESALYMREVSTVSNLITVLVKSIFCGMILTIAVKFAREARDEQNMVKILPLLIGVPLFLTCGFFHCIVDTFYITYGALTTDYFFGMFEDYVPNLLGWFIVVLGNFIGCNLPRLIMFDKNF